MHSPPPDPLAQSFIVISGEQVMKMMNKNTAYTFLIIFGIIYGCVTQDEMFRAMEGIGFVIVKQSGGHTTFRKTSDCRLSGVRKNISFGGSHGKESADVSRRTTKGYDEWLEEHGVEWEKIQTSYLSHNWHVIFTSKNKNKKKKKKKKNNNNNSGKSRLP